MKTSRFLESLQRGKEKSRKVLNLTSFECGARGRNRTRAFMRFVNIAKGVGFGMQKMCCYH